MKDKKGKVKKYFVAKGTIEALFIDNLLGYKFLEDKIGYKVFVEDFIANVYEQVKDEPTTLKIVLEENK